ncbi:hypothetical protein B2D07_10830 [Desulfococcus multivorans]|nr:hypothetical protein B2D07_10830 [Desulfococcus multivorans]
MPANRIAGRLGGEMKSFKISELDIGMPAVLAGAGVLTLIICLIVLIPGKETDTDTQATEAAVAGLENRVVEMENRLNNALAALEAKTAETPSEEASSDAVSERTMVIQSLTEQVASLQKKIEHIDSRQGNLEQRVVSLSSTAQTGKSNTQRPSTKTVSKKETASAPAARSTPKKAPERKVAAKTPAKKTDVSAKPPVASSAGYHVVAAGETRYGIARRYGLNVAELDRLNGFTSETIIQPGQKIRVRK